MKRAKSQNMWPKRNKSIQYKKERENKNLIDSIKGYLNKKSIKSLRDSSMKNLNWFKNKAAIFKKKIA